MLQRRIRGGSKFDRVARYRSADLCYLVVRKGICGSEEVPPGWGVLEWDEEKVVKVPEDMGVAEEVIPALSLVRRPERAGCGEAARQEMLRRIAEAATRLGNRRFQIPGGLPFAVRRSRANF